MNIFVLGTGRCGTTTFMQACKHVSNFSTAHESRANLIGERRLCYPKNHIEVDNRLSWLLGRLDEAYGKNAFYVHLMRNEDSVAKSYLKRWENRSSIVFGYRSSIILGLDKSAEPLDVVRDMCQTVNANITQFLKDKPHKAIVRLESINEDFGAFWNAAKLEGNRASALAEWDIQHNSSERRDTLGRRRFGGVTRVAKIPRKLARIGKGLPGFIKRA
ncbi:hypothetical protein SAMN05444389_101256 [Paracoccus solventivorans]|uniref:Sulfotransferase family protein n=2 Tax=Paracoccus solventivorans TaxID=53463 RepID=A0A1M7DBJ1_9RHOB|nr:hypothetical protein SAMN05444389_101256 [Paracoccus solventivorans]